jgi:hypothetical protein
VDVIFFDPGLEVEKKTLNLKFVDFSFNKITTPMETGIYTSMRSAFDFNFFATISFFEFSNI